MEINSGNFEEKVIKSDKPVLVDFWASWCVPCQMQGPVIEQLDKEVKDFYVGKVNVEEETELQMKYGISSIPALLIFKDGKCVKTLIGFHKKEQILQEMAEYIS
ncbi:MAG: thioredoxin [Lachnospiraceae bacterium]|nr:thioredoxin [Lachnospiraceae bacterium]